MRGTNHKSTGVLFRLRSHRLHHLDAHWPNMRFDEHHSFKAEGSCKRVSVMKQSLPACYSLSHERWQDATVRLTVFAAFGLG